LPFKECKAEILHNNPVGFTSVKGKAASFAALTMFAERGFASGHYYQPPVNCRHTVFDSFLEGHPVVGKVDNPPLIDSMVMPGVGSSFSVGNLMALYCYEVFESNDPGLCAIHGPAALTLWGENNMSTHVMTGKIKSCRARAVSRRSWTRVLQVFGIQGNQRYTDEYVSCSEMVAFFEYLCTSDLSCVEGLDGFIKKHNMEWLYTVDTSVPIYDQLNTFFALIRAVVPLRIAAYDGRHRYSLCCYFATGYFEPSRTLTLTRSSFDSTVTSPDKRFQPTFQGCAVFQEQLFLISQPEFKDGKFVLTDQEAMVNLRRSGVITTSNQMLAIDMSFTLLITEFVEYLLEYGYEERLVKFNFSTFWHPAQEGKSKASASEPVARNHVTENHLVLYEAFKAFLEEAKDTRMPLALGNHHMTKKGSNAKEDAFALIHPTKGKTFTLHMGRSRDGKPPTGVGKDLGTLIAILKLLCDDMGCIVNLRDLLEMRPSSVPQINEDVGDLRPFFRSMNFLYTWIYGISLSASNRIGQKIIVEKAVVSLTRKARDNPHVADDVHNNFPKFPCAEFNGFFKTILLILQENQVGRSYKLYDTGDGQLAKELVSKVNTVRPAKDLKDLDLKLPKGSAAHTEKCKYAAHASLFRDIVGGVLEFGLNPKIELVGKINHRLHFYLK
jgi:hypothetical protein